MTKATSFNEKYILYFEQGNEKNSKKISFYQFPNITLITDMNVIVKWVRILLCDSIFKNALFPAFSLIS